MRAAGVATLTLLLAACTTPLERGERLYRQGDGLGALESWRAVPETASDHAKVRKRIEVVETEFERLVVQYKQRGRYYEERGRLAESILNYRLALKLQRDDATTLAHVQQLARTLVARKEELQQGFQVAFDAGDLASARRGLARLRELDPLDPELETEERQFQEALRAEVTRRLDAGRRGFLSGSQHAAQQAFRSVLELDPDNESARGYLAYLETIRLEGQGASGPPGVFVLPDRFASDAQIRAEGFYQNALAAENRGDSYAAIRNDLRALEADADHASARRHLAALRERLADSVDGLIEAGREAFRDEDLQTALDAWRQALLLDPDNERTRAYIARAEQQIQNLERLRAGPDVATGRD
jgi:tetratricopeptide (TPR) repeat protein